MRGDLWANETRRGEKMEIDKCETLGCKQTYSRLCVFSSLRNKIGSSRTAAVFLFFLLLFTIFSFAAFTDTFRIW